VFLAIYYVLLVHNRWHVRERNAFFVLVILQDFSDEWQDLDDLLEEALEEGGSGSPRSAGNVPAVDISSIDEKLSKLDGLVTNPAEIAAAGADAVGAKAAKAMEAFLGGDGGAGRRQDGLGEEEERLLQMVSVLMAGCPAIHGAAMWFVGGVGFRGCKE